MSLTSRLPFWLQWTFVTSGITFMFLIMGDRGWLLLLPALLGFGQTVILAQRMKDAEGWFLIVVFAYLAGMALIILRVWLADPNFTLLIEACWSLNTNCRDYSWAPSIGRTSGLIIGLFIAVGQLAWLIRRLIPSRWLVWVGGLILVWASAVCWALFAGLLIRDPYAVESSSVSMLTLLLLCLIFGLSTGLALQLLLATNNISREYRREGIPAP